MKTVLVVAGGTGGHLAPGLALAEEFSREASVHFLTLPVNVGAVSAYGAQAKLQIHTYRAPSLKKGWRGLLLLPLSLAVAIIQALQLFFRIKPHAVVLLGGYPTLPAGLAALFLGRPFFLCEQNAMPGRVTRLLAKKAKLLFTNYPLVVQTGGQMLQIGNPVRQSLRPRGPKKQEGRPTVLVLGGSQGAEQINELVAQSLSSIEADWLWQCGAPHLEKYNLLKKSGPGKIEIFGFHTDVALLYEKADLLVCRAGAGVLSEAVLYGIPMLLIPYPYASDNHQKANAMALVEAGAARLLEGRSISVASFQNQLHELLADPALRESMGQAAFKQARPQAAALIWKHIKEAI